MYRLGLSETVLVFPEHHEFLRDVPLNEVVGRLRRAAPEKKLVIEVTNSETAVAAAVAGFDVVQAEKFAPAQIVSLVAQLKTLARAVAAADGCGCWRCQRRKCRGLCPGGDGHHGDVVAVSGQALRCSGPDRAGRRRCAIGFGSNVGAPRKSG